MSTPLTDDPDQLTTAFGIPVSTDAGDIADELRDRMAEEIPGWQPIATALDTAILAAVATVTAEGRDALQQRLRQVILDLAGALFGFPRSPGTPAQAPMAVTAVDTLGHVLPAGEPVMLGDVELYTVEDAVIPAGSSTATVAVQAVEFGAAANGADGELSIDAKDWLATVDGVVLTAPLDGGTDPWDDDEYLERFREHQAAGARSPVLPHQWAAAARSHPAVGFAWAIRAYNAATDTAGVPFHVTIVVAGLEAEALPGPILADLQTDLQAQALDNVIVHVVSPDYVPVDVTGTGVARAGYATADVDTAVEQHLQNFLSPGTYARPREVTDEPNPAPDRTIHVNELIARADDVPSLDWVEDAQIGDGSSDRVTLTVRQLPTPGTIAFTTTAPGP
ncbi:hypothetical protein PAI11_37650 [Patulibacter medicamentivorans]|uniref:Baseplate protein J-like barrel domain-containing protein n=1 Tax=Patulibacter medicamentivorans TaxID=1097667 RepID=H0EA91_9ACTN|nr:baseplate J/gp47 family protein [Patulibacter medicamentivorans]EHN09431.1 hypothetical protein PAI11_37650 [Patulibacter medicamentivorans]